MDEAAPRRKPEFDEISGLTDVSSIASSYIGELGPDPRVWQRYRQTLGDDRQVLKLYRETLRDERAMAALDQRLDAAVSRPWDVEPGGDSSSAADTAAADHLRVQIRGLRFNRICRQTLFSHLWFGFAVAEVLWAPGDEHVGIADIRVRAPDRFLWSAACDPLLVTRSHPRGEELSAAKFVVLTRPGEHGDTPYGPGLGRWCFWPVWFKRHGLKFWAVALERFGSPTGMGTYRQGATESEVGQLVSKLESLATASGIALPEGQTIQLLEARQRTGGDFEAYCGYLDRMLATTILGQSSTTDQGPWRGTAEVQQDVRNEVVAADCRTLNEALSSSVARWLTAWNFPGAATPKIVRDVEPPENLDARAEREERIARTSGLRPTREHIEKTYGGRWEEIPVATPPAPGALEHALRFAADDGDAISRAADLAGDDWEPLMEPNLLPLLAAADAALERGESLAGFRNRIARLIEEMDEDIFAGRLHRNAFSATISGAADETEK